MMVGCIIRREEKSGVEQIEPGRMIELHWLRWMTLHERELRHASHQLHVSLSLHCGYHGIVSNSQLKGSVFLS